MSRTSLDWRDINNPYTHLTIFESGNLAKEAGRYKERPIDCALNSKDPQKRLVYKAVIDMLKQRIPVVEIAKENRLSRPTIYKIKKSNNL